MYYDCFEFVLRVLISLYWTLETVHLLFVGLSCFVGQFKHVIVLLLFLCVLLKFCVMIVAFILFAEVL